MPNFLLGKDCLSKYSTTLLTASTNTAFNTAWSGATAINNVKDLTLELSADTTDVSTRGSGGWKQTAQTLKDGSVTLNMQWLPGDAGFSAFQAAYINNTEIAAFVLDGSAAGSQGLASNFNVMKFTRKEGLTDTVTVDVELKPSSFTGWMTKT